MLLAKRERTSFLFSWQLRGALILSTGFNLAQFWTKPRARWSRKRGNRAVKLKALLRLGFRLVDRVGRGTAYSVKLVPGLLAVRSV